MTPEEPVSHRYIGDGVYVEITPYHIILRTRSHIDDECDNKIFLEPSVYFNMIKFVEHYTEKKKELINDSELPTKD